MRGPQLERIEGGDPTFRVEIENHNGKRWIPRDRELMQSHEASRAAREIARIALPRCKHVHVVNERTGFTRDTISYEPIPAPPSEPPTP